MAALVTVKALLTPVDVSRADATRLYRVGRIGADKSLYSCLCQRDITLFWTMYEALLAAMLTLSRRERWEAYDQSSIRVCDVTVAIRTQSCESGHASS